MKREEWDTIRMMISDEMDAMLKETKEKVDRTDMDNLYFNIRERVEKNIKIED
ncbi:hypothetical protein ACW5UC_25335 [Priestia aryabhattai]|jgi:hypothetical protein|uniref:hypothetical protein n=1 Tax=Priestia megaterium TaxID=1404 RepID=UPI003F9DEFF8